MQDYIQKFLISRTQTILEKLNDYVVYVIDNAFLAVELFIPMRMILQIAAVTVAANYRKSGVGDAVVSIYYLPQKFVAIKIFFDYSSTRLFYQFGLKMVLLMICHHLNVRTIIRRNSRV